jgi:PAS domain S-box-containing protein
MKTRSVFINRSIISLVNHSKLILICTFFILVASFVFGGYVFYVTQSQAIHERKINELHSISKVKVDQIVQWRRERISDAQIISSDPLLFEYLYSPQNISVKSRLHQRLNQIIHLVGYQNAAISTENGKLLISTDPNLSELDDTTLQAVTRSSLSNETIIGDFYINSRTESVSLDIASPVIDSENSIKAVIILQIDPKDFLYPQIQSWPVFSETAETLLVEKSGGDVVFLNPLRYDPAVPLSLRIPLTSTEVPAVQAALGVTGQFEGKDYRGINVLAEITRISDSPWFMIAKVDQEDLLSEIKGLESTVLLFVILSILMTGILGIFAFNYRQRSLYKNLFQSEHEKRKAQEEIQTTLYSIGDGVITTDQKGLVTRLNPVAETLTGWNEIDAKGQPLSRIFHIVDEYTQKDVENPVERVLREGLIVGLANHTQLISRNGINYPIADSGAPIKGEDGTINGVVLVFRDQTGEREIQRDRALLNYTISNSLDEIYLFDAKSLHYRFVSSGAMRNLGYEMDRLRSMTPIDIDLQFTLESYQRQIAPLVQHKLPSLVFETLHRRANGSSYPVETHLQLFEFNDEMLFLETAMDITKKKENEEILRTNESRLENAQAMAHVGNWEIDLKRMTIWGSDEAFRIYGLENRDHIMDFDDALSYSIPGDREKLLAALDVVKQGGRYELEYRICRANDHVQRVIRSIGFLETEKSGDPIKIIGVIQDISEAFEAELSLRESEERYRSLFQNNYAAMLLINPEDGSIVDANPAACEFYGWKKEEFTQKSVAQINTLPENTVKENLQSAFTSQRNRFEFKHRKKDGQISDVEVFSGPIRLNGKILLYSIIHDITERTRIEEQVKDQLVELRRWHSATLGRETRVIELKQEVNDLLDQLGRPAQYLNMSQDTFDE